MPMDLGGLLPGTGNRPRTNSHEPRIVMPFHAAEHFADNTVRNSRYTIWTFLPKNLYEQFRRPLNLYFLLVAALQFISIIAPVNPLSTLMPLLFAFALTAAKEGYDDVKRHRADAEYNGRRFRVLDVNAGQLVERPSCELHVGDVIQLQEDDEVPCDCIAIAGPPDAHGSVFIRTENLDGEIDLKPRDVVPRTNLTTDAAVAKVAELARRMRLTCPPPNSAIEAFDSTIEIPVTSTDAATIADDRRGPVSGRSSDGTDAHRVASGVTNTTPPEEFGASQRGSHAAATVVTAAPGALTPTGEMQTISLNHRHLLLQSSYVKATEALYGIVVYTGNETKCGMNKKPAPKKWAKIDRAVSRYSMIIFTCQILCALGFGLWGCFRNFSVQGSDWYLAMNLGESVSGADASWVAVIIYPLRFFLLTSVMIPISFKFVVDMSKAYMALVLEWDLQMWDDERGEGMRVKDSSIVEDLAQIDFVLSDKTGTLTQNVMALKALAAQGEHLDQLPLDALVADDFASAAASNVSAAAASPSTKSSMRHGSARHFSDTALDELQPPYRPEMIGNLARALALCNTAELSSKNHGGSVPLSQRYTSVSPDEVALCAGAAALGYALTHRTRELATVTIGGRKEIYRVLYVFAFTSDRKCMSIVLQREAPSPAPAPNNGSSVSDNRPASPGPDEVLCDVGEYVIVTKGADERVMAMVKESSRRGDVFTRTQAHVDQFARQGLRTLVFAKKILDADSVQRFRARHEEAMTLLEGRQLALETLQKELERDMTLIGASAVEDALQVDVKQSITHLLKANVGVWMLTGDKVETAQQISVSCGLLPSEVTRTPEGRPYASPSYLKLTGSGWEDTLARFTPSNELLQRRERLRKGRAAATEDGLAATVFGVVDRLRGKPATERSSLLSTDLASSAGSNQQQQYGSNGTSNSDGPVIGEDGMSILVEGGLVLDAILNNPTHRERFLAAAMVSKAVVCARVTPSQKAAITALVNSEHATTLSIGDGGNDVAMIQEAHVGVGIIGKEGQQAARAADFAITQFRHIVPLMFVHGHMSYARTCYVVQYSFYKSMLISFIQIAYNVFFGGVSGVSFWNSFFLTVWNGVYTLPQTFFYSIDRCAPRHLLLRDPTLYRESQAGYRLTKRTFFTFILRGMLQSVGLLLLVWLMYGGDFATSSTGDAESVSVLYTVAYTTLILHQLLTVILESNSITGVNALFIFGMPLVYVGSTWVYSAMSPRLDYYGVFAQTMRVDHWAFVVIAVAALYLPHQWAHQAFDAKRPSPVTVKRKAAITLQRKNAAARASSALERWLAGWLTTGEDEIQSEVQPFARVPGSRGANRTLV